MAKRDRSTKPLRFIVTGALLMGPAMQGCEEPVEPNEPYEVVEHTQNEPAPDRIPEIGVAPETPEGTEAPEGDTTTGVGLGALGALVDLPAHTTNAVGPVPTPPTTPPPTPTAPADESGL